MIKIDSGTNDKGQSCSLGDLAVLHYEQLIKGGRFKSPLDLINMAKKGRRGKRLEFLKKISEKTEFERLIISDISQFKNIIAEYSHYNDILQNKDFNDKILECFSFKRFRKSQLAYLFSKRQGVKTCPYCNSHLTLLRHGSKKVDCELDHFYPKKKYPYLSISYYNLIPCCSVCNRAKSDEVDLDVIHPYDDSFYNKFRFSTDKQSVIDFIIKGSRDFKSLKILTIAETGFEKNLDAHNKSFHLNEIHQEHKDIVFEIYSKVYHYPESRKLELCKLFNSNLFKNEEIERFVLGNYVLPTEINNRPLTKFMQDIGREAGLITKLK